MSGSRGSRALVHRVVQLYAGLVLYGASAALQVRAGLGLDPWDVFHQGVSEHSGLSIGMVSIIVEQSCCCCGSRCASGPDSARCRML